jgi:hypothetical protein
MGPGFTFQAQAKARSGLLTGLGSGVDNFLNDATVDAASAAVAVREFGGVELLVQRIGEPHGAHDNLGLVKADDASMALLPRLTLGFES